MDDLSNIEQRIRESYFSAAEQDMGSTWRRISILLFLRKFLPFGLGVAGLMAGALIIWIFFLPRQEGTNPGTAFSGDNGLQLTETGLDTEQTKEVFTSPSPAVSESASVAKNRQPDGFLKRDDNEKRLPGIKRAVSVAASTYTMEANEATLYLSARNKYSAVMGLDEIQDTIREVSVLEDANNWIARIGVYAGASYEETRLKGNNTPQVQLRNSQEAGAPGYEAGIELTAGRGRFFTGIGLRYKLYQQRAVYNIPTDIPDPSRGYYIYDTNYVWVYDPPQTGIPVVVSIDSNWVVRNKILEWNGIRRMTRIEVPVFVGYSGVVGKTTWEAALGGAFSLLIQTRGALPGMANDTLYMNASLENFYQRMAIKTEIRLGTVHELGKRWQAFSRLTFGMFLHPYNHDTYPANEYHISTGFQFGIRYQLNKGRK